ncbi:hypothetical protein HGRIS_010157 [Hohenbuehelia grisea]
MVANQEDGPPSPLGLYERLRILKEHQARWPVFRWTHHNVITTASGGLWELNDNILALYHDDNSIVFQQIPSKLRGIPAEAWTLHGPDFDIPGRLDDLAMDPKQDLLILISDPRWDLDDPIRRIFLRTMSAGRPHPLAAHPATLLHEQPEIYHDTPYMIQIYGAYLGILFLHTNHGEAEEEPLCELIVWNWKTGCIQMALHSNMASFAFLDERYVLAVSIQPGTQQPVLLVYDYCAGSPAPSMSSALSSSSPAAIRLDLPLLRHHWTIEALKIRFDPTPLQLSPEHIQVPFFSSRAERLFVLEILLAGLQRVEGLRLCIPYSTILRAIRNTPLTSPPSRIEWPTWGPQGTRMLCCPQPVPTMWKNRVQGMRFVDMYYPLHAPDRVEIGLFDFNPLAARRGSDPKVRYIRDATVIPGGYVFEDDVSTSLPYRRSELLEGWNEKIPGFYDFEGAMCTEDAILVVYDSDHGAVMAILSF